MRDVDTHTSDNLGNDLTVVNDVNNTKVDTHKFALLDVMQIGQDKMKKDNVHSQRLRKKQRSKRHDLFMLNLCEKMLSSDSNVKSCADSAKHGSLTDDVPVFTMNFRCNKFK